MADPQSHGVVATLSYASILQKYESKIVASLEKKDLIPFVAMLCDEVLLPHEVKESLDIMHKDVPHKRRCRYVMQYVYKNIGTLITRYKKFLKILSAFPQGKVVILNYKLRKPKQPSERECGSNGDVLGDKDLGSLCEFLSEHAYKWEDFAIALLSDSNKVSRIKHECNNDLNKCLRRTLEAWLSGESKCNMSPTVKNMKKVLRSGLVNLPRRADELDEHLQVWGDSTESSDSSEDNDSSAALILGPRFIDQPDQKVAILLEFDIQNQYHETVEWYKNGISMKEARFCILCIIIEDLAVEGVYTCSYFKNDMKIKSEPLNLCIQTPVDDLRKVLVGKYLEELEVNADIWPTVEQNTFIQLAVIGNKTRHQDDQFTYKTIRGDADDILSQKARADYMSLFKPLAPGNRVLIEGRPGSGKTTLVHKVSQDWANKNFKWDNLRLLFLVHLRGFQGNPHIYLKDIVTRFYSSSSSIDIILRYAEWHGGLGIGFILDGMDEYQPETLEDTYINKLIQRLVLPRALVIVASRPAAVALYRRRANVRIEVLGFFKKQITEYVESYQFSSMSKCSDLIKILEHHPNVYHMCYLPIQAAMICFLFDILEGTLPRTETKIYEEFTKHKLLRTLYRIKDTSAYNLKSIFALEGQEETFFNEICKLAFNKTSSNKQILLQSEVGNLKLKGSVHRSLGIITIDLAAHICGFENMYTFFHLTFQEFLAACYIVLLSNEEQHKVMQEYGGMTHMKVVFKFYCGLVKYDEKVTMFRTLLEYADLDLLSRAQCSFETQHKNTCEFVMDGDYLDLCNQFLSPVDQATLGYTIVNAKKNPVKKLKMNVFHKTESLEAFLKEIKLGSNVIEHLYVCMSWEYIDIPKHFFEFITDLVKNSACLVSFILDLSDTKYIKDIVMALQDCRNLVSFDISGCCLEDDEMCIMANLIKQGTLTSLFLEMYTISDVAVNVLTHTEMTRLSQPCDKVVTTMSTLTRL